MKYMIELEQADDGGWSGMIDNMPGLLLMGETLEALLASVPEAVNFYLEDSGREKLPVSLHPISIAMELAA